MHVILFLLQTAALAAAAPLATRWLLGAAPAALRATAALLLAPCIAAVAVILCGNAGILGSIPVAGCCALPALVAAAGLRFAPPRPAPPGDSAAAGAPMSPAVVAALGALGGALALRALWLFPGYWVDDFSYHAAAPAEWVQTGRIALGPPNYHAYYPFTPHTLVCWLMLPFQHDGLIALAGLHWMLLQTAALYALVRLLGGTRDAAGLAALCAALALEALRSATSFAAVDLAGSATLLAGLAALTAAATGAVPATWRLYTLAGLAFGYAIGAKISFAVPAAAACAIHLAFLARCGGLRQGGAAAAAIAVASCATGLYWYARNALLTGNPLFPFPFAGLPAAFGTGAVDRTKLATWLLAPPDGGSHLAAVLWAHLDWPHALGVAALLGAAAGPAAAAVQARRNPPHARAALVLIAALAAALLAYPVMPYSGANHGGAQPLRIDLRFLLAPYALALGLLAAISAIGPATRRIAIGVLAAAALLGIEDHIVWLGTQHLRGALWAMLAAVAAILVREAAALPRFQDLLRNHPLLLPAAAAALVLTSAALLAAAAGGKADFNGGYIAYYGKQGAPVGRAWNAMNALPPGRQVTAFGPGTYMVYPLMGRRLQHRFIQTDPTGRPYRHLHEPALPAPGNDLVTNLLEQDIDTVFVTQWDGKAWPPQRAAIDGDSRATRVYDDKYSAIYTLAP